MVSAEPPIHTYPLNDMKEHVLEGRDCWCKPEVMCDGKLIVHNSMDGRELIEQHGLQ